MFEALKRKDVSLIIGDNDDFRRCNCGELVRVSTLTAQHIGHMMRTAYSITLWEYIKIKVGLL